jgi:isopentenyldiphosphate isomerase
MTYRIVFYDAQGEIGSRLEPSDLDAAKAHAQEGLILHHAASVRIIDSNDEEVWTKQAAEKADGALPV